MKTQIFSHAGTFPRKVNFVDSNNVFLGYDLDQDCCERAYWIVSKAIDGGEPLHVGNNTEDKEVGLDGYVFDPSFFEMTHDVSKDGDLAAYSEEDAGRGNVVAVFKLVHVGQGEKKPDLHVLLVNNHNGYYKHKFTFRGERTIEEKL